MHTSSILAHLKLPLQPPIVDYLNELLVAYTCVVPWETVSRIVKRSLCDEPTTCVRWPDEFWGDAIKYGTGGTCFESNYAFFTLLQKLGFEGYLTINNMGDSIGCHTAIIILLDGQKWLVDAGMPLYGILPINPAETTHTKTFFHMYDARPDGPNIYQIERDMHPKPNCFTLFDKPIPDDIYRQAMIDDYGPAGLFLDRLIITKVKDSVPWRFVHNQLPLHLETYPDGTRVDTPLPDNPAPLLSQHFHLDQTLISTALNLLTTPH